MATALSSLVTYCQKNGWLDQTTAGVLQCKIFIDTTIQLLGLCRRWKFFEKEAWLNLTAPYTTGTVAMTIASTGLVGTGTTWAEGMAGQEYYTAEDSGRIYRITTFTDTTHLTLASAYLGSTASGKTYSIRYVRYAAPTDWGQEGAFFFQDGREINWSVMTLDEFLKKRMMHRATSAYPTDILFAEIAGTKYFFIHPPPSAAKQVTYNYWKAPDSLSGTSYADANTTDWPDRYLGLLHAVLKERMATDDSDAGLAVFYSRKVQDWIDAVFRGQGPYKPVPVSLPGDDRGLGSGLPIGSLGAFFNVLET